ncbi:UDP-N-acetylglucosamine 2-epimerase (non-hydrolyzing) [Exiguobacterium sp. SH3S2]|uniref:non-hydrolyzing UDP-N-acetylglucosamine 2-epimerase n=1 Tax=unclassified Exiguobacterium TaxID=2644629 RepID=UPI0010398D71|nr:MULTISPECIES: UDP-N-acetylglucosamine 2-epimerase (non-hydrolyzing) [unclassified Exiguobacterium]TCI46134.1 UDP-N-acetylglucosamine 2-epimerase (non-hydrolyzing) [Exiguobacterium sp. SH3S3]TCI61222.1 UDP-N-acetylglucosamine 2-epimerase (non-hydrolyzing) [Exiguobacterium sp. SH3S2]
MHKILLVFGTRPEAIKMAPLALELKKNKKLNPIVVVTAQHREMLDQVLNVFEIHPDYDLDIMSKNQTLAQISTAVLNQLDDIIKIEQPDILLVHGDTTTTFSAALAAFYNKIPIGHVEAGLRTYQKYSPYPEEINRCLTGVLTDLHFAPTESAALNLSKEGYKRENIYVTGNTAIDALKLTISDQYQHPLLSRIKQNNRRLILLTAHRRENLGEPLYNIFEAVRELIETHPDVEVVYPIHLNPTVQEAAQHTLHGVERVHLIEPLSVIDFHNFMAHSYLILTDSGGIQEEAPSLGVPVLVLRDTTERPEGVEAGTLKVIGTQKNTIFQEVDHLLEDKNAHKAMSLASNPYGDGFAAKKIVDILARYFGG